MLALYERVVTPLGAGCVAGFERLDRRAGALSPATVDPQDGCRVIVKLDDPARWACHAVSSSPPHFSRREITRRNPTGTEAS